MSELLEFGQKLVKGQPFSALFGSELEAFEPGEALLSLPVRDELKQQYGLTCLFNFPPVYMLAVDGKMKVHHLIGALSCPTVLKLKN